MKKIATIALFLLSLNLLAADTVPDCLSHGQVISIDNAKVLNWKSNTKNQYHDRGHVIGNLLYIYPDHSGHYHFQVQIGENNKDTIEVIYNENFGKIQKPELGSRFEACGDYITSNAPGAGQPASPDGAIIHWVHKSPNTKSHDSGYVVINGVLYGLN
jgi:hypothetical protein